MTSLAEFIASERGSILERFVTRAREADAARSLSHTQLIDHLPSFFDELITALRAGAMPEAVLFARSQNGEAHGAQRLLSGYDLESMVREYGNPA